MNKEIIEQMSKVIKEWVPEVVEAVFENKYKENIDNTDKKINDVEKNFKDLDEKIGKIKFAWNSIKSEDNEKKAKSILWKVFKQVADNKQIDEKWFMNILNSEIKTMTEWTAGAFVFDQFEKDVIRVLNTYSAIKDVKIYNISKWDKLSIPKMENGVVSYYVAEWTWYTPSDSTTSFITIDISKIWSIINLSEELINDTMTSEDVYTLIIESIGESQGKFIEKEIFNWTWSIKWILPATGVNVVRTSSTSVDSIDYQDLINVITASKRKYKKNRSDVKWYMSQYVLAHLQALTTSTWAILFPSLLWDKPTLLWYNVRITDEAFVQDAVSEGNDKDFLLFGDMKYYFIVRRKWLSVENGFYADNWAKDIKSIKSNQRIWWDIAYEEAFTKLKSPQ